jgi:hypothetical protein
VGKGSACPDDGLVVVPDLMAYLPWHYSDTAEAFWTILDLGSLQVGKQLTLCSWRSLKAAEWIDYRTKSVTIQFVTYNGNNKGRF